MKRLCAAVLAGWLTALAASAAMAETKLSGLSGDNAVLQRGMKTPVWGTADPGERVTVTLGAHHAEAVAGQDGPEAVAGQDDRWMVRLGLLEAGGPLEMTVAGKNTLTVKNVMVGEMTPR